MEETPENPPFLVAYQCDHNGWLRCAAQAFASPLEPGVYHVPGGATLEPPPPLPWPDGAFPRRVAGVWVLQVPQAAPEPWQTAAELSVFLPANPEVLPAAHQGGV